MKRIFLILLFFLPGVVVLTEIHGQTEPIIRKQVTPKRIVWMSDHTGTRIKNPEYLLIPGNGQADLSKSGLCYLINSPDQKASVILDFGIELQGALQIITGITGSKKPVKIRVRLGE